MKLDAVGGRMRDSVLNSVWSFVWHSVSFSVYDPVSRSVTGFVLDSTHFKSQLSQRM
jgi:hypothetical protein